MPGKSKASLRLILANDEGLGSVGVELESFVTFNRWLNRELEALESKWAHVAVPHRGRGLGRIASKPKPK